MRGRAFLLVAKTYAVWPYAVSNLGWNERHLSNRVRVEDGLVIKWNCWCSGGRRTGCDQDVPCLDCQLRTICESSVDRVASWRNNGGVILVEDVQTCGPLVDRLAPEHLEIATEDPRTLFSTIRNAGSAFLGRFTPEPMGDYIAGPNHVLPTARAARYASGLGVLDFMKRTTFLGLTPDALATLGGAAQRLAEAEGLGAHARAIAIRGNRFK